jgi:hypothetical protein
MAELITDKVIADLISEEKYLPQDFSNQIRARPKRGHSEREIRVSGANGSDFFLMYRQSLFNNLDFSIILGYSISKTNIIFRLRRYNGKSHEHTNTLEKETFYDFHIHEATERYQLAGLHEESYARPTSRYSEMQSALDCMLTDCNFILPKNFQLKIF